MARSDIPMRKWAIGIYPCLTSLKSVSSMKLHRDLGISQPSAWFIMHRIREAWACDADQGPFDGPVEFEETFMGGKRRKAEGPGPIDLTAVAYKGIPNPHETVKHSLSKYVNGMVHTIGIESF